jgi:hypothetical protein
MKQLLSTCVPFVEGLKSCPGVQQFPDFLDGSACDDSKEHWNDNNTPKILAKHMLEK